VPRQVVILSKFIVVSSFEELSVLEVDAGKTFLEGRLILSRIHFV
jgi:hypothetical protein